MKIEIIKAPATIMEVNMFRRSDGLYVDIGAEQYKFSIADILALEDLDTRSNGIAI